jgi:hypothetical protein
MRLSAYHILLLAPLVTFACKGDDTELACEGPIVAAGPDQAVSLGDSVTLASTSTLCPDVAASFTWTFEQVPVDSAIDDTAFGDENGSGTAASVSFIPDAVGSYVVSLQISDGVTASAPDLLVITVTSDNLAPIADAGEDVSGQVGTRVIADGTASRDPDGTIGEYAWTLASKPSGSALDNSDLYDATTDHASFVPDAAGRYVVALVVSDNLGVWSISDYASIDVGAENRAPFADAGTSRTLPPCTDDTIELNGFGSYDPDGDSITYGWTLTSKPTGSTASDESFDDPRKPNPKFSWDKTGAYTFQLKVNDGELDSAYDVVTLTVVDSAVNRAPVANGGADQTASAKADCTTSDYVWTCEMCEPQEFDLDASSSSDPDGDAVSFAWSESTGQMTLTSPATAVTTAISPKTEAKFSTGKSTSWTVGLQVADCNESASDSVKLTVTCVGEKP